MLVTLIYLTILYLKYQVDQTINNLFAIRFTDIFVAVISIVIIEKEKNENIIETVVLIMLNIIINSL